MFDGGLGLISRSCIGLCLHCLLGLVFFGVVMGCDICAVDLDSGVCYVGHDGFVVQGGFDYLAVAVWVNDTANFVFFEFFGDYVVVDGEAEL